MHTNSQTHASTQFYTPTYTDSTHTHIIPHIHSIHKITYIIKHMGRERKNLKQGGELSHGIYKGRVARSCVEGYGDED